MSMKNSNDTVGNPTRDLPAGSAVPHATAPPRALFFFCKGRNSDFIFTAMNWLLQ
jgi:hypothetical protein